MWESDTLARQIGRDRHRTVTGPRQGSETFPQLRVSASGLEATNGAGKDSRGRPAPAPCTRDLETFTPACSGHHHPADDRSDPLLALRQRRRGRLPEGRHVVGERRNGRPLRRRQRLGLRLHNALVRLLQVPFGRALGFPRPGERSGHQAVLGFDHAIVPRRPLAFGGGSLQTGRPESVQCVALLLQTCGGFPRQGQGGWRKGGEDPLPEEGIDGCTGEIRAMVAPRVGRQQPLVEIWALCGTLIADLDGIDDPGQDNNRLWVG